MIRVLVAEDSATVRELLVSILGADPEIEVVGQAAHGGEAVELAVRLRPDVVTMDIHMPVMDGLDATKEIMALAPTPIVIVSSHTSGREVELSLSATRAGALLVLRTPDNPQSESFDANRQELLAMVKAMSKVKVVRQWGRHRRPVPERAPRSHGKAARLVAIAASTGGPAALQKILTGLPRDFPVPILVVQHISNGFIQGLTDWLGQSCNLHVKLAHQDEPLSPRTVYIAPDDRHLGVTPKGRIVLENGPLIGGFRPSANHLFREAARSYGSALTAVILTGMGRDGVEGLRDVRAAGGRVLAQDEATSVVFGMPREAIGAGLVDEVLPIQSIAARMTDLSEGGKSDR